MGNVSTEMLVQRDGFAAGKGRNRTNYLLRASFSASIHKNSEKVDAHFTKWYSRIMELFELSFIKIVIIPLPRLQSSGSSWNVAAHLHVKRQTSFYYYLTTSFSLVHLLALAYLSPCTKLVIPSPFFPSPVLPSPFFPSPFHPPLLLLPSRVPFSPTPCTFLNYFYQLLTSVIWFISIQLFVSFWLNHLSLWLLN